MDHYYDDSKVAVQSKNVRELTFQMVQSEVEKTGKFPNTISRYFIVTACERDGRLQDQVWTFNDARRAQSLFSVQVVFWNEIRDIINRSPALREKILNIPGLGEAVARLEKAIQEAKDSLAQKMEGDEVTFDDLKVQRHLILNRPIGNVSSIFAVSSAIATLSFLFFLMTGLAPLLKIQAPPYWLLPWDMLALCVSFFLAARAHALKQSGFTDTMPPFRKAFFEADASGDIFITKLSGECPYCRSKLELRVVGDWREHTEEIFVCKKNSEQHRFRLDHTMLPEIKPAPQQLQAD